MSAYEDSSPAYYVLLQSQKEGEKTRCKNHMCLFLLVAYTGVCWTLCTMAVEWSGNVIFTSSAYYNMPSKNKPHLSLALPVWAQTHISYSVEAFVNVGSFMCKLHGGRYVM